MLKDIKPPIWRGPSIAEIARESGLGTATVDRVVNGRGSVREATRLKVMAALDRLKQPVAKSQVNVKRIAVLSDSGLSYNRSLEFAVNDYAAKHSHVTCAFNGVATSKVDPVKFANLIERIAAEADGLIIVAREDLTINRAIRNVISRKIPVVCLTTDLPTSGRFAYIGSDPTAAGSTAAYLMGQVIGNRVGRILLVYSAPYRGQEERELGFRRVLRSEFPNLIVEERVNSNDDSDYVFQNVVRYIEQHGAPAGVYNVGAGNIGIGKAISQFGLEGKTVFIGHELNPNSRHLLETGVMSFAIGHDVYTEIETAMRVMVSLIDKKPLGTTPHSMVRVYTKYSCN